MTPTKCFACDKPMRNRHQLVACADEQTAYVGPECFRHVKAGGRDGYQPPMGGPRLYLLEYTKHGERR